MKKTVRNEVAQNVNNENNVKAERKPKDRTIATKVVNCFSKELRKSLHRIFTKIETMNAEQKADYDLQVQVLFNNLKDGLHKIEKDIEFAELFLNFTPEQIEILKEKLNK